MKQILKSLYQNSKNKKIKELILDSFNKDCNIRFCVAYNPNTPVHVLERLSNDEEWFVRVRVTDTINAPIHILEKLSKDKNYEVRYGVVRNPTTPVLVLEYLSKDEDYNVRECAKEKLNWINKK